MLLWTTSDPVSSQPIHQQFSVWTKVVKCSEWTLSIETREGIAEWIKGRELQVLDGTIFCQLQTAPLSPRLESQLGQELQCKKRMNPTLRGTHQPPSEMVRKTVNSNGVCRYHAWVSHSPWMSSEVCFGSHCCQKLVNIQNLNKFEDVIGFIKQFWIGQHFS